MKNLFFLLIFLLMSSISVHGNEKWFKSIEVADYLIKPEIKNVSLTDYRKSTIKYLFQCGEEAVKSNWDIFLKLKEITIDKTRNIIKISLILSV